MNGKYLSNEEFKTAIDEIFKNVAHQWRQPLSKINSNVFAIDKVLRSLNISSDVIEEKLLEIESLTKYMSMTIDDFKPKVKTNLKQTFFIKDAFDKVNEIVIGTFIDNNIEFCIEVEENFTIKGYEGSIVQALTVIVNNAKDILLERNVFPAKVDVIAKRHKENLIVSVSDNGGGITKSAIEKIFNPDYTTKHSSEGSGVGLNMAKKIIENNFNAELNVHNIDEGTCFEIRFCFADDKEMTNEW